MLVIDRKPGEKVIIDSKIVIEVLDVRGDRVRLGFTADPSIQIDRMEVAKAKGEWPPKGKGSDERIAQTGEQ